MKQLLKLEKLAEAREGYQVLDLVLIRAAGIVRLAEILKTDEGKAAVHVLEGLDSAHRPQWSDEVHDIDLGMIHGALSREALAELGLPEPPDPREVAARLVEFAESLEEDAKRKAERAKHMPEAARRVAGIIRNRRKDTEEAAARAAESAKKRVADSEVYQQAGTILEKVLKAREAAEAKAKADAEAKAKADEKAKAQAQGQGSGSPQGKAGGQQPAASKTGGKAQTQGKKSTGKQGADKQGAKAETKAGQQPKT